MRGIKRVAAVHDLSCFGRCSLAVILPVLSVMGVQCCPMPTAVLSSHTGGYPRIARTDLTGQLEGALAQWRGLPLTFDGVYTGYMASPEQIRLAAEIIAGLKGEGGLAVVDPVLGDHGRLYSSITADMAEEMKTLCSHADVITPNLTEANLLLGRAPDAPVARPEDMARELSGGGSRSVVITGVSPQPGRVGALWFDRDREETGCFTAERVDAAYPGTGDLFAAVLTGGLVRGESLSQSAARAVDFVRLCADRTLKLGLPAREGVEFEPLLGRLVPPQM